jgi:cytosine deaminase
VHFDRLLHNARLAGEPSRVVSIAIRDGRVAAIETGLQGEGPAEDLGGRLVVPGFVETHIHLDKSCLLGRCECHQGTLAEAVALVSAAKLHFTEEDVYQRGEATLRKSIAACGRMWRSILGSA